MTEKFTAGRVSVDTTADQSYLVAQDDTAICRVMIGRPDGAGNARRLAACWNACEGIPTDILEAAETDAAEIAKKGYAEIIAMREQRDELLALLEEAVEYLGDTDPDSEFVANCKEVIAEVTGGAA